MIKEREYANAFKYGSDFISKQITPGDMLHYIIILMIKHIDKIKHIEEIFVKHYSI